MHDLAGVDAGHKGQVGTVGDGALGLAELRVLENQVHRGEGAEGNEDDDQVTTGQQGGANRVGWTVNQLLENRLGTVSGR